MYSKLEELIRNLKPGFFGQIEVGVQNGKPCQVRITETFKLTDNDNSGRMIRGVSDGNSNRNRS
jgi:hypothetical protein